MEQDNKDQSLRDAVRDAMQDALRDQNQMMQQMLHTMQAMMARMEVQNRAQPVRVEERDGIDGGRERGFENLEAPPIRREQQRHDVGLPRWVPRQNTRCVLLPFPSRPTGAHSASRKFNPVLAPPNPDLSGSQPRHHGQSPVLASASSPLTVGAPLGSKGWSEISTISSSIATLSGVAGPQTMDDFGILARDFGFRPQGKNAPMTASKGASVGGVNLGAGSARSSASSTSWSKSRSGWNPTGDSLLGDHGVGISDSRSPPAYDDVFGPPPSYASPSSHGHPASATSPPPVDSVFEGFRDSGAKPATTSSLPVYDKPVYDDDIFGGVRGMKSSSVKYHDVFASMSAGSNHASSPPYDDLLDNLGKAMPESKGAGDQRSGEQKDQDLSGFEESDGRFGGRAVGVTEDVLAFARNISMHPETWLDFPLLADDEDSDDFDMSDVQQEHALAAERLAPRLAALRIELCPTHMSEGCFWKIYFVLFHPRLNKHDAELLSTPQIVEGRAMLLQRLQGRTRPEAEKPRVDVSYGRGDDTSVLSTELQNRCVNMIAHLFNAPIGDDETAVGVGTVGSSEAIMLAGLAFKRKWQNKRKAEGKPYDKPNIVTGANVQVCWEKFARYFEVQLKEVKLKEGYYIMDPVKAVELVDENTICVAAILGSTLTGEFEDVKLLNELLTEKNKETGWDTPIHVDAASGGFIDSSTMPSLGIRNFSSQSGAQTSGSEVRDGFSDLDSPPETNEIDTLVDKEGDDEFISEQNISGDESEIDSVEVADSSLGLSDSEAQSNGEKEPRRKSLTSPLFKVVMGAPRHIVSSALDRWVEEGNSLGRDEVYMTLQNLRKRRFYWKALQFVEWLEASKRLNLVERDYASHLDLIAKVHGLQKAEKYITMIPESFRGEVIYRTLLANCVSTGNVRKSEEVFNKIRDLGLPITTFSCNQLLLLYKRIDRTKIADVLMMMEKEGVKPSPFTYRLLIDAKGRANDITGMEQIVERMNAEGLKPDLATQALIANHYIFGGLNDKAEATLKEIHATVRAKLEQTYAKYKAKADQQRRQQSFEVGDLVWVYLPRERYPQGAFTKLKPKKIGPCQVLEKFGDNAYRVELPDDVFISDVFNIRHLTPYAGENSSLRSSFSEEGESDEDIKSDQSLGQSNQALNVPVPATQSQQATSGKYTPGSLRRSKRLQNKGA